MLNMSRIFQFLAEESAAGRRVALVTVTAVTGASVRNPGAQMAVSENGASIGTLSGGCIEASVIAEAHKAIAAGKPHEQLYGAGSPFIDIRLPCGGSVHLLFTPVPAGDWARQQCALFDQRQPVSLRLPRPDGSNLTVTHAPPLQLTIFGHGGAVDALVEQASAIAARTQVYSPDSALCDRLGPSATRLISRTDLPQLAGDPWTAFVFLFHDHDWEAPLLSQVLALPRLYCGAMGSRKTHATRVEALLALGVSEADIASIAAPIGLIPSSRDPETLALSALVEIVAAYNATQPTRVG